VTVTCTIFDVELHFCLVCFAPANEPAPREGVLDWRGMWGFEIAI
jgi:hypothetical protein